MPRQMKDSGIEWIGDIPRNWNIGKVSYFFDVQLGKMLQPVQASEDETLEYYLCAANVGKNKIKVTDLRKMWFSPAEKEALKVQEGDLLVVEGGDVASCDIMEEETNDLFFQNALHRVRPKDTTDIRILKYILWLAKSSGHIDLICNKATIAHFSKDKFRSLPVVVMPLDEQRHVADYLDLQCARIDSVLEQTRSSIEEYKKLKQAVVTQAVTKGVRGDRAMKDSEVEWLGNIPADWNVYRIANLYDERSESGLEELPILTVSINTGVSDYEIADEDRDRVFVRSEDRTKYKRVYPGDLAYNMMRAWQGAFGAVRVDGMVSPAYVVAKPKKNVELDSRYMEALLRTSEATEEMHRYSRGIVDFRLRLYWPEFKNIRICLPSIEEQIEIADYVDEKVVAIDALITKKEAFAVELENYKKSMIYEYVTGKKEVL